MLDLALCLNGKLAIESISPLENANTFDLLCRERFNVTRANEAQAAYATAIREGDVLAIGFKFPARLLVFHRTVITLETGIALLPWLVRLAVVIETGDGKPRSICCGLTGLGVETCGKGEVFGQHRTVALQIIAADTTSIHPQAQALVTDELCYPYRFLNGRVLCCVAVQLVLVDQY